MGPPARLNSAQELGPARCCTYYMNPEQETTWVTPSEGTWVTVWEVKEGELNVLLPRESEGYAAEQRT